MPRPARTEDVVVPIRCGSDQAEIRGAWSDTADVGTSEGWSVKEVEKLRAEFRAVSLSHVPFFGDRHVHTLELRSPERVAAGVTVRSVGRRRQDPAVLDVAGVIVQRPKSQRHLCGIARIRSLCGRSTGGQYVRRGGGQSRAARD